ncbi:MAG: glycosyltransferase [Alphaproteobacteria bacterium]|nr:glycosyltransferase [Alphaproteobacteria bacterium]
MADGNQPTVTIYIVNHNYGRFLEQAIESVLGQTFRDFELLIIDDGSTDDSRAVIDRYVGRPGVMAIHQHNQGLNVTNNIALRASAGRYLMRLDADDWLDSHALGVLVGTLDRHPEIGLVFPDYYLADETGAVQSVVRRHDFTQVTLLDQPAHGACTMIRRECLEAIDGYDEQFRCQDGYDLWVRFISRFGVRNVNLPLFYYRQHGSSLTRNEERILATRSQIVEKRLGEATLSAVAILPVRGMATDPHSTALRQLGGKPLIDWTIEAALAAKRVVDVVVTTPDEKVLDHVGRRFGERVMGIRRSRDLARPNSFLEETVADALKRYVENRSNPTALALLYVESPFRGAQHIDAAIDMMELFSTDRVIGVRPETDSFYRHTGSGLEPLRRSAALRLESDELYRAAGDMEVVRTAFFNSTGKLEGGRVGHVVLDKRAALSLIGGFEWEIAEALLREQPLTNPRARALP